MHLLRRCYVSALSLISLSLTSDALAADELLVYVFDQGKPVAGASVFIADEEVGTTQTDGSARADLSEGGIVLRIGLGKLERSVRFSRSAGQLVDVAVDLSDPAVGFVEVYSQREAAAERRGKAEGTLDISVRRDGEPVVGSVVAMSAGGGVYSTDDQGIVSVVAPRGVYSARVDGQRIDVRVFAGVKRAATIRLPSDAMEFSVAMPQIEEVVVMGSFDPNAFEVSERDTGNIVDTLGVEELARFGDTDVAASIIRVPGVSVQGGKYVVIRGLGNRYVTATLNGSSMPSTNPSKRTVPLDLFPSGFVNQLDVKKTFLASMPGESTGGNLVINTKTFPDEAFSELSLSMGVVSGLTGSSVATDPISGGFDAIGWDDGTREEHIAISTIADILKGGSYVASDGNIYELDSVVAGELRRAAGLLMMDGWDPSTTSAKPEVGLGISFGDVTYLGEAEVGYFIAGNYGNSWSQRDNGQRRTYGGGTAIIADDFIFQTATNNIEASALASVGVAIGDSTFEWNNLISRDTESFVERFVGVEGDEGRSVVGSSIQWEERQYVSTQILGSHFLNDSGSLFLEWQMTASQAKRDVPDRRESSFIASQSQTPTELLTTQFDFGTPNSQQADLFNGFFYNYGGSNRRFNTLTDNNYEISFDLSWDVYDSGDSFGVLKLGGSGIKRDRLTEAAIYGFSTVLDGDVLLADSASVSDVVYACGTGENSNVRTCDPVTVDGVTSPAIGGVSNSVTTGLTFTESTLPSDNYEADLTYNSAYALYDHTVGLSWQFILGARLESYDQTTETFSSFNGQALDAVVDESKVLPHLGVNWSFTDTQQLRFAISKTVARPDFKETANAYYQDLEFGAQIYGNPFLETSDITNGDLRWEWYYDEDGEDSFSVAVFYKEIENAIERVVIPASGTAANARTFQNSDLAELTGIELEGRLTLQLFDSPDSEFFVDLNAASIESEVTVANGVTRAMQGQPEYTANLILGYDNFASGQQVTLLFNQNGKTVADGGIQGAADVILEPRLDVQLVYRWDISEKAVMRAKIDNLLNSKFEYTQGGNLFQRYERGSGFSVSVDWEW